MNDYMYDYMKGITGGVLVEIRLYISVLRTLTFHVIVIRKSEGGVNITNSFLGALCYIYSFSGLLL